MNPGEIREQIRVSSEELVETVKKLMHEGNVTHIFIKHDEHTVLEIPVTIGVIGLVLAPVLAAVAAVAATLAHCTLEVVRTEPPTANP